MPEAVGLPKDGPRRIRRTAMLPFVLIHAGCILVAWTGASATAFVTLAITYALRAFGLTAGYHRYFSHRSFRTSRRFQLLLAVLGAASAQMGPLWWASHHRRHHRTSDRDHDVHSPMRHGFLWAHVGWIFAPENARTRTELVRDLARYPELLWLDRHHYVVPLALAVGLWSLGEILAQWAPRLGTSGLQLVVFGFFISTTVVYHLTFAVNSLGHLVGSRRFATADDSRNSFGLALLTWGEGWHNNHHRYPGFACQGLTAYEPDLSYAVLRVLERFGIVWRVRHAPSDLVPTVTGRCGAAINQTARRGDLRR